MRYCITREEVQWAMKDSSDEWIVPINPKKGKKGKQPEQSDTSQKTSNSKTNTIKDVDYAKGVGGSVTTRKMKQRKIVPKPTVQEKDRIRVTNGGSQ
jgi:hypothetical protein